MLTCILNSLTRSYNSVQFMIFSLLSFPEDSILKNEWILRCCRQGLLWDPEISYVCSNHFCDNDYCYDQPGGSRQTPRLKNGVVPSRNLPILTSPICLLHRLDFSLLEVSGLLTCIIILWWMWILCGYILESKLNPYKTQMNVPFRIYYFCWHCYY